MTDVIKIRYKKGEKKKGREGKRSLVLPASVHLICKDNQPLPPNPPPPDPWKANKKYHKYVMKNPSGGGQIEGCQTVIYSPRDVHLKDGQDLGSVDDGQFLVMCECSVTKCKDGESCGLLWEEDGDDDLAYCDCSKSDKPAAATPKAAPQAAPKGGDTPKKPAANGE